MKYYFSDSGFSKDVEDFVCVYAKNRLISYHYKSAIKKYIELYSVYDQNTLDLAEYSLLIDSGAYSIWNSGQPPINPAKYAYFCQDFLNSISHLNFKTIEFINLDVIPGVKNQPLTHDQIKYAQEKSWENYLFLNDKIPNLLPVFHQGDSFEYITKIEQLTKRYCISPANDKSVKQRLMWIQDVYRQASIDFKPHGLGFSNTSIAKANPWYSFDASTHALRAGFGVIMYSNGKDLIDIVFSDVRTKEDTGTHFGNLSKPEQQRILSEFLEIDPIFTYENVLSSGKYRKMLNMYFVSKFYETLPEPKNIIQGNLFM